MLLVDQRFPVKGLADLKDLAVAALPDGPGIETDHGIQAELLRVPLTHPHPHPPVRHDEFVTTARPTLMIEETIDHAVLHELPARRLCVHHHAGCALLTRRLMLRM